jgi:hypothetical protein
MEDDMQYEIVHDKVRIAIGSSREWLVYVDGVLRAECTNKQAARDYVAILKTKPVPPWRQ